MSVSNIHTENPSKKSTPGSYSDEDAKRFQPINDAYMLSLDRISNHNMKKASERLTAYADVMHRLYHVFIDITNAEQHGTGTDPFWTEPLAQAAELFAHLVDHLCKAIGSAVNMTGCEKQKDPLRKLANLPELILTHEGHDNLIVQFSDADLARGRENGEIEREKATLESMTAMRERYAVMLQRFQVFFSDMCDLAEGENVGFYAVDDLAAYQLWRIAWELEKELHNYHHSIVANIASLQAMQPLTSAPESEGDHE